MLAEAQHASRGSHTLAGAEMFIQCIFMRECEVKEDSEHAYELQYSTLCGVEVSC